LLYLAPLRARRGVVGSGPPVPRDPERSGRRVEASEHLLAHESLGHECGELVAGVGGVAVLVDDALWGTASPAVAAQRGRYPLRLQHVLHEVQGVSLGQPPDNPPHDPHLRLVRLVADHLSLPVADPPEAVAQFWPAALHVSLARLCQLAHGGLPDAVAHVLPTNHRAHGAHYLAPEALAAVVQGTRGDAVLAEL
jgi:hypothetical protein